MDRRVLLVILVACPALPAIGQIDAEELYRKAQAAYEAGSYAEARDLALKASKEAPDSYDVFLLLGKAHYQLGTLDDAIVAWRRTVELEPEEPYAKRMLAAVRGARTEVDARIKLVATMVGERLFTSAASACKVLLAEKALSTAQRAAVMTLHVEAILGSGESKGVQTILQEIQVLYTDHIDAARTKLLMGMAKLRSRPSAMDGVALLREVIEGRPGTPPAIRAEYELLSYELRQNVTENRATRLAQWVEAHPDHPLTLYAVRALVDAYLDLARQGPSPKAGAKMNPFDLKALNLAGRLFGRWVTAESIHRLTTAVFLKHVDEQYAKRGAYAAAAQGVEVLRGFTLPRQTRPLVLQALARIRAAIARRHLEELARTGALPATANPDATPKEIRDVTALYEQINKEYPASPAWRDLAAFAVQVRSFSAKVVQPESVIELTGPDGWALDLSLLVLKADGDAASVKTVADIVRGILGEFAKRDATAAWNVALRVSRKVLAALSPENTLWPEFMSTHAELLDGAARRLFAENEKAGNGEGNASLSDLQKELLDTLTKQAARHTAHASAALTLLEKHLAPWVSSGHCSVVEEAYDTLGKGIPEIQRRTAALSVVSLLIQHVEREHQRIAEAGLTVPRKLDPLLAKAAVRCYDLHAGLTPDAEELQQARSLWDRAAGHYKALEYYEVAEAVYGQKGGAAVDAADAHAAYRLAVSREERARRELDRFLKRFGASEKIELGDAFAEAIEAYRRFIKERPSDLLTSSCVGRLFGLAGLFEKHRAFRIAAKVYGDLAEFAATVSVLSQSTPGSASIEERASLAAAGALDALARSALDKTLAAGTGETRPPAELSAAFSAAIDAYQRFTEAHAKSPLVETAISRITAVALTHAEIGAWEVAESVYAALLDPKLALRRPERILFCRGLCRLGHALPDHARELLKALNQDAAQVPAESSTGPTETRGPVTGPADPALLPGGVALEPTAVRDQARPSDEMDRLAQQDGRLIAMIHRQESSRAAQVARLRDRPLMAAGRRPAQQAEQPQPAPQRAQQPVLTPPVLSEAELTRQEKALTAAYTIFQDVRTKHPHTATAQQARAEIFVMVAHWRSLGQWQRSVALARRFLTDNSTDHHLPKVRLEIARDLLAWAAKPVEGTSSKQVLLGEVAWRFDAARSELASIVADFPQEHAAIQQAQWSSATSFLSQARVVAAFSPTLARGQYVRAANELIKVASVHPKHPKIRTIPQVLWSIAAELESRDYNEEALIVWNELTIYDPLHSLAQQAALKIAQTYHHQLKRPLRAAEAYQELNFARGGNDQGLQNAIFQIGTELKNQKRWVEALHILETFVDSFPRHPQAGQALTTVGQIHQINEAWEDAISAYRRVITDFKDGKWVQDAKWSIAECTINLSRWREAMEAYRSYVAAYPKDGKVAEAKRRIDVLKSLVKFQGIVDEEGQRKAFDAQYQIAAIVAAQLSNPVKAIIEYRKVAANWPQSHLADDALYAVGTTFLSLGETDKARESLQEMAKRYPASPLTDDALFMVGKSYEDEATRLATVTREKTIEMARDTAQRQAYREVQSVRRSQARFRADRIADLKKAGKAQSAEVEEASRAANWGVFNDANVRLFAQKAVQEVETLTATQLADRQDKINAALRRAVEAYTSASKVAGADKADDALLKMATIYDQRLRDSEAAMATWLEIVRQFSGTAVAEDASWRIAQYYERNGKHADAIKAYNSFLRNYRRSPKAGEAQFAIAENYEHLGEWVNAMDSYTNYMTNFPEGPLVAKAKEQISWIKTYRL